MYNYWILYYRYKTFIYFKANQIDNVVDNVDNVGPMGND